MPVVLLALDAGTGSGRAAVIDPEGRLLACAQEEWAYQEVLHPGDFLPGYQFDPEAFWGVLARSARRALETSGVDPKDVAGVAATSQREGSVFLDGVGRELLAAPNFDARAFQEGIEITDRFGAERLYRTTGHVPAGIFALARLLWWRRRFPDRPVARVVMISDWITWRLTGRALAEPSNAGESLLFDVGRGDWARELLDICGIPQSVLPELRPAGAPAGAVTREAAAATGLLEGTPVFTGGADTQCALLGSGATDPGQTGVVLGTTTPVQLVVDRPEPDFERQLWVGVHVVAGRWVVESNAGDTGKAYLWLLDVLGARPTDPLGYEAIERLAGEARAESPVFSFVGPSIFDLRNMNPSRAAGLLFPFPFGRPRPGPPELYRGFLESVAFAVRANLEQIEASTRKNVERLHVGGGMSRGDLLLRLLARVCGRPLLVSEVPETAALGCTLLAGTGAGLHTSLGDAVRRAVRHRLIEPDDTLDIADRYERWRELYHMLGRTTL